MVVVVREHAGHNRSPHWAAKGHRDELVLKSGALGSEQLLNVGTVTEGLHGLVEVIDDQEQDVWFLCS